MNIRALAAPFLIGALALAVSDAGFAQSTLGGSKPQQNKIGGVAKPPPVVGGATVHTASPPTPPKPGPVINLANKPGPTPGSTGATMPQGPTANNARPNPPVTPPSNKGAKIANLKCSGGACTSKGPKP
jgi:hypothetical protein